MTRPVVALAVVGAAAVALCCVGVPVLAVVSSMAGGSDPAPVSVACQSGGSAAPAPAAAKVDGFSADQVANATTIVRVGQQMAVPPRGWVIAVATAMQEDSLRNSKVANDHDSLGLFQQRPSQGWGTPEQVTDPVYASRKFYERLLQVPGWQSLPLTEAAQRVQRSAFPDAYAKHEAKASALVDQITGGVANAGSNSDGCAKAGEVTASGWTAPVAGAKVGSGFRTADRPTHQGVDLMVPKRTPVRSVADGTVIRSICDANINCDRDGSPSTPGCGWYVDIRHAEGIITRYCHMIQKPAVNVGDHVSAGQQIGLSGTSGHSSGPHLHFEVHHNGDEHAATGAIEPIGFMRSKGVKLGD